MKHPGALLLLLSAVACGPAPQAEQPEDAPSDTGLPEEEEESPPLETGDPFCAEAPTVTWASFGRGFLIESCQGCHASTAPDRHGAPPAVSFDSVEDAWIHADRILARASGESPTMPPNGGVAEDDLRRLEWWLRCAEPGT